MTERLKLLSPAVLLAALVTVGCCLLQYESDYLWRVQELNLFLDTPLYLKQQMVESGWLITWLGSYFTEFFYHPWIGVTLLCCWWALLMAITSRAFHIPMKWWAVLLIPVAALLLADVDLGYWIYYLKLRGHFFAGTIGTTIAIAAVWLYRLTPKKFFLRSFFIVIATGVLYPLIGFYGLMAAALMGLLSWRLNDTLAGHLSATTTAILSIALWPLFYYQYIFFQTNLSNIFWTGLPLFFIDKEYPTYYIPYYILGISLAAMAVLYRPQSEKRIKKPLLWTGCNLLLIAALIFGVQHYWYKDGNFHKELRMLQCVERQDWEGTLSEAAWSEDEPTRAIVMMRNLALFRLGRQGDEMYHYKTGAKASDTPIPVSMAQVVGRCIYFNYGQLNFCYRWCLEDGVEHGWKVEYLKYLIRCSIVNGDHRVARKYIDLLRHTRYYGEWAMEQEQYLNHPKAIAASKEFAPILHLTTGSDVLAVDNNLVEKFLMNQFTYVPSNDSVYLEQSLLSSIWMKDINLFWPRFFRYANSHSGIHMPIHYQEAAYLYGHLEHTVNITNMPFDKSVIDTYNAFMQAANRCAGMSEDQMREVLYPQFGDTFYYEYYLVRNQKMY